MVPTKCLNHFKEIKIITEDLILLKYVHNIK